MADPALHIVVAERFSPEALDRLRAVGRVTTLDSCDEADLREAVVDCDALLVRTYAHVTRDVIACATKLKVIGRGGVGLDNIDVVAASEHGVTVVHTPAAATGAVAELTIALMLGLLRDIPAHDAAIRSGDYKQARANAMAHELSEMTLGIIGMGRIGQAVARRCHIGLGMSVIYNDIVSPPSLDFTATPVEKEALYRRADVVSLHVPLTDLTRCLIDSEALAQFKADALLINTSRGQVVDSSALANRLHHGAMGGAALDVLDEEPPSADHPLLTAPHVIFTPHIGAKTPASQARMNNVVDDVIRVLQGAKPMSAANVNR